MNKLVQVVKNFWYDEEGVTAIEYGLLAALIAVFIIGATQALGTSVSETFTFISNAMNAAR